MGDSDPDSTTNVNRSGGADLDAERDINIGGDVIGRDKIVITEEVAYKVEGLANPYLGLQSFTYADHAKYAGREKLITETVARLTPPDEPLALLFVTGASGSGKSSFVQARVLPALEQHYAVLSLKWAVFRPSRNPMAALSDALWRQLGLPQYDAATDFGDFLKTHTPAQQVNVIVIDQFEELFTQSNAQPRDALFNLLTHLPPFRSTRTHLIATVRADYLPDLFALPGLYDIAKRGIDLRAMSVDELREAIQQPLRATHSDKDKRFPAELVERLAQDAAEDAAYLPLLQVTLEEIWRKGTLTLGSYTNLADAIKLRADKVLAYQDYDAAQPDQPRSLDEQAAILNLCLDLVDVSLDDEARRDVRRRRSKDELISGAPERLRLIDTLAQARLLSVATESGEISRVEVDLIHETLLSNWDRLRQAIAERRHELRQRVRFEQQLKEWIGQNRSDDYLSSGVRLAEARELERRDDVALHTLDAKDFVHRSVERDEARRKQELNDARRRVIVFSVVAIGALMAAGVALFFGDQSNRNASLAGHNAATAQAASTLAVSNANTAQAASTKAVAEANSRATAEASANHQRDEIQRQAAAALSRQLASQAELYRMTEPDLAMLLSVESYMMKDTGEARDALLNTLQYGGHWDAALPGQSAVLNTVAFSPDGRTMASDSSDNGVRLWDVSDPKLPLQLSAITGYTASVASMMFSPDGETLAINNGDGTVLLWNVSNPASPMRLGPSLIAPKGRFSNIAFSPNGRLLASGGCGKETENLKCIQGQIQLWDVTRPGSAVSLGAPLTGHTNDVVGVAFSSDNKSLYSGSEDATIIMWDVTDPKAPAPIGAPLVGTQPSDLWSLALSPDGKLLAAGRVDTTIVLWDVTNPMSPTVLGEPLRGQQDSVGGLAFSPNSKILASLSGGDPTVLLWDLTNPRGPTRLAGLNGHATYMTSVAFSADGKTLATADADKVTTLWNVTQPWSPVEIGAPLAGHAAGLSSIAINPAGTILASGSDDTSVVLWDVADPQAPHRLGQPLFGHGRNAVWNVTFGPAGRDNLLASSGGDKKIALWDVTDPIAPVLLSTIAGHQELVTNAKFSPDGKTLASASYDDTVILWDITDPQKPRQLSTLKGHLGHIWAVVFSPDGQRLASGSADRTAILWDISNRKSPVRLSTLSGHTEEVTSLAFSPDGKMLASGSDDTTVILWDVSRPRLPTQLNVLAGKGSLVKSVIFSPDGKTLAVGEWSRITLWDVTDPRLPIQPNAMLSGHTDHIWSVAFSPDGKILVSGGEDKTIILWDVAPESWQIKACARVRRNLTQEEWKRFMGDMPYRKTCEQWPLESEATPSPTP